MVMVMVMVMVMMMVMVMVIEAGCIARKFTEGRKEKEGGRVFKYFYFKIRSNIIFVLMEIARHVCNKCVFRCM